MESITVHAPLYLSNKLGFSCTSTAHFILDALNKPLPRSTLVFYRLCAWLFISFWSGCVVIPFCKPTKSYLFKWNAPNILMPDPVQSLVYVGNIKLILFKLWYDAVSLGIQTLTKTSKAPRSIFLIQGSLPGSCPEVLTKYDHLSWVETRHIAPLCRCSLFFIAVHFCLSVSPVLFNFL